MKTRVMQGFTVVEIIIVVVVIAILSTVTAMMYGDAQSQAKDVQIRDAAVKLADAVQLFSSKNGRLPRGGTGSSAAIGSAPECANGADGWASSGAYTCAIENTLIASGYLPSGFTAKLPQNKLYPTDTINRSLMVYAFGTDKAMVFFSQESPTADDTTKFNAEMTQCGINPAGTVVQRDSGMRGGICFQYR